MKEIYIYHYLVFLFVRTLFLDFFGGLNHAKIKSHMSLITIYIYVYKKLRKKIPFRVQLALFNNLCESRGSFPRLHK